MVGCGVVLDWLLNCRDVVAVYFRFAHFDVFPVLALKASIISQVVSGRYRRDADV